MSIEIKVPVLPESVTDATVAKWYKSVGDRIERDDNLVDLETDKVMLEVPAPNTGVIEKILVQEGAVVTAHQVLAIIAEGEGVATSGAAFSPESQAVSEVKTVGEPETAQAPSQKTQIGASHAAEPSRATSTVAPTATTPPVQAGPAVRRSLSEADISPEHVTGTGKKGRVTKGDVQAAASQATTPSALASSSTMVMDRQEKRVPMTRIRARIAERLVQVQHEAAILTTFNEVDMQAVMTLRENYKKGFEAAHGVKLGFMSFFTKAVVEALKRFPAVNASIDGQDIVYHNYYDIGIAIGSPRGLVVPIIRNADMLSMAEIEQSIKAYGEKAKTGHIAMDDMTGGTFTITNGGVYGSMLSTPILNPPQSAILGMHNIVKRPVVVNDEIVIRPMMYLALSYDHRIVDGKESVSFLVTIKQLLEDPARLLLQV